MMNWMATENAVRIIGILGFVFVLYSLWMGQMSASGLPDCYTNPVLALELVKSGADIDQINRAEGGKAHDFVETNTKKDYAFIVIYVLFRAALGVMLSRTTRVWSRVTGIAAAGSAILGGLLDVVEDRGMLMALKLNEDHATNALANSIRFSSLAKWALLFGFALLIGLLLLQRRDIFFIPATLFLLAAALGLTGVLCNLLQPNFYWMFPAAIISMGLASVFVTITFAFWPLKVCKLLFAASP